MKILITGGAGYLGSVLTPTLLAQGHEVTVLDNFYFNQNSLLDCCQYEKFQVVRGDCREESVIKPLVAKADLIIPLAALVGVPLCNTDAIATKTTNQEAVEMLCRLAGKQQWVIMPVTNSGYGVGEKGKFCTEDTPLRPISSYGVTKVKAEEAVLARDNSISFRLATVFGCAPRMRMDLLVNDFVYRAVHDRAVLIFEGHFKRNYIHIRDVARAFLHGMANFEKMKGRPYNVGLDEANLSKLELCAVIQKHLPKFVFVEAPIGEDPDKRDYIVSNARIAAAGFKPEWSLDRGITELIKGFTILRNTIYSNVDKSSLVSSLAREIEKSRTKDESRTMSMKISPEKITAVVLAGGFGTRIRHLLPDLPKPMAPVNGRPFLEWVVRYLAAQKIRRVIISTGHLAEIVAGHFQSQPVKNVRVSCVPETRPLGTAGGFLNAIRGAAENPRRPGWC